MPTNSLGKGLGYFPYPDERDHPLKARIDRLKAPKIRGSKWWQNSAERLNQGAWPACVGYSHVQALNCTPKPHSYDNDYALELYKQSTYIDEWPQDDWTTDGGTSVRAGAKVMQSWGHIPAYAFTKDVEQVAIWVLNKNPVVIGVDWWSPGMDNPTADDDYYVRVDGHKAGGHALVVDGVRWNGDNRDYLRLQNSWGSEWSQDGRCKIEVQSLEKLLSAPGGQACTWVES